MAWRRLAYQVGVISSKTVGIPVVSVGGLTIGGSGKTPAAIAVVDRLVKAGTSVAVVHGGYRGKARAGVCVVDPQRSAAASFYGDESVLLARRLPAVTVIRGQDKVAAARLAVERGAEVVVVDDGFQSLRLQRDLDIVMCDEAPGVLLPTGRGRESPEALDRAALLWHHNRAGVTSARSRERVRAAWLDVAPDRGSSWVMSCNRPGGLFDGYWRRVGGPELLVGQRVFVMAAIARPDPFLTLLRRCRAKIVGTCLARDHASFRRRHWLCAARAPADLIVCTEKDLARLDGHGASVSLVALRCDVEIIEGGQLLDNHLSRVRPAAKGGNSRGDRIGMRAAGGSPDDDCYRG